MRIKTGEGDIIENKKNEIVKYFQISREDIGHVNRILNELRSVEKINNPSYNLILEENYPFSENHYLAKAFMTRYEVFRRVASENKDRGLFNEVIKTMLQYERYNKYSRGNKLGSGGFGEVYAGTNTTLGIPIAIKILNMVGKSLKEAMEEEYKTAHFIHPNIVELHGVIYDPSKNIGKTFARKYKGDMTNIGNISENRAKFFFKQIVEALIYIHNQNFVHNDLKPANFFMKTDTEIVVADFGLVTEYNSNPRNVRRHVDYGTPIFLPPEFYSKNLFAGKRLEIPGTAYDVWAAGVSLYLLISGNYPFDKKPGFSSMESLFIVNEKPVYRHFTKPLESMFKKIFHIDDSCLNLLKRDSRNNCDLSNGRYTTFEQIKSDPWYNT